ncbi:MAG TPA: hypothetical protein VGM92_01190 [Candidatus Kapabacteria bacterium]
MKTPAFTDLNNAQQREFLPIEQLVKDRKNYCSFYERGKLVALYFSHGAEKLEFVVDKCMANDWLKPDRWTELMEAVEKYGREKVEFAIKAMNRLENHSIDMVINICDNPSLAKRKFQSPTEQVATAPMSERQKQQRERALIYPTKEGIYTELTASKWLREVKKLGVEHAFDYFTPAPPDEKFGWRLFQLKPEYR